MLKSNQYTCDGCGSTLLKKNKARHDISPKHQNGLIDGGGENGGGEQRNKIKKRL